MTTPPRRPPTPNVGSVTSLWWPVWSGRFEVAGLGPLRRADVAKGAEYVRRGA